MIVKVRSFPDRRTGEWPVRFQSGAGNTWSRKSSITGTPAPVALPGGHESLYRFLKTVITVHVGDTVEWINFDSIEPHTITFGCPTDDPTCPTSPGNSAHVSSAGPIAVGPDGSWAAEITKPFNQATDQINSGLLLQAREDAGGQPQANPALTNKFSLKFDFPGDYRYLCELHDQLGMAGHVIVLPKGED